MHRARDLLRRAWLPGLVFIVLGVKASPASAQTTYYTGTTTTPIQWLTDSVWSTNSTGPFTGLWNNDGSSAAFFSGNTVRTFTITGSDAVVSGTLSGNTGVNTTFNGASGGRLRITGATPTISQLSGGGSLTFNAPLVTNAGSTLTLSQQTVYNGGFVFGGTNAIGGSVVLGSNVRLNVTNANAFAGATSIATSGNSILSLNLNSTIPSVPLVLSGAGNANGPSLHALNNTVTWAGPVTLSGSTNTVAARVGGTLTLSGSISGGGGNTLVIGAPFSGVTDNGGGTTRLSSASSSYAGQTILRNGTLLVAANAPNGASGALGNATSAVVLGDSSTPAASVIRLLTDGELTVGRDLSVANVGAGTTIGGNHAAGTSTFSGGISLGKSISLQALSAVSVTGAMSGTGGVTKTGAGTVRLSAANSYSGPTILDAGTFQLGDGGATGSLSPSSAISGSAGATLVFNRSNTITQGIDFASAIGGEINITKLGAGSLVLDGVNTFSGTTRVSAGMLRVASGGSINGTSGVVLDGAGAELQYDSATALTQPLTLTRGTLSGIGTIGTGITIGANTILAPGNSPGTLTASAGATWSPGGTYEWEINSLGGTAGTNWDRLDVTAGGLNLGGLSAGNQFILDLVTLTSGNARGPLDVPYVAGSSYGFLLASYNTLSVPGGFSTAPGSDLTALFDIRLSNWQGTQPALSDMSVLVNSTGNGISLVIVPEPAGWILGLVALGALAVARRRSARPN